MGSTELRVVAQQALEALYEGHSVANSVSISNDRKIRRDGCTLYAQTEEWCRWADGEVLPKLTAAITALEASLAEPPVDDPHRDHWVAIAEAAQKIAASTECGLAEAKALCAALDRLTDAAPAEPVQEPVATLNEAEKTELLDWVSACQSAYAMESNPRGPFRPLPGQLRDNRKDVVDYVNEILESRTAPPQRKPLTEKEIEALFEAELLALPPYPSATEELPVRLARAIERAHGITP